MGKLLRGKPSVSWVRFLGIDATGEKALLGRMQTDVGMKDETAPISFPGWRAALARSGLPDSTQVRYRGAIVALLTHCKALHAPISVTRSEEHTSELQSHRYIAYA